MGAKCAVDCLLPLRFPNNSVCTSNDTLCHITQQFTSLPHIILIISGERYKLWSYSSCSFIHFPSNFRFKSLNTLNSTVPIFSLQSILKVTHQVSYTRIYKKSWVNMHTSVSQKSRFQTAKKNYIKIQCALLQIHFLSISSFCNLHFLPPLLNIWEVLHPFKMSNTESAGFRLWFFFSAIKWRNVAIQFLCSTDQTFDCRLIQLWISIHHTLSPDITASPPQRWSFYVPVWSSFSMCPFES